MKTIDKEARFWGEDQGTVAIDGERVGVLGWWLPGTRFGLSIIMKMEVVSKWNDRVLN